MTETTYIIRLPDFEGPLDLLLHLIEREELDITRLSLAQVADQYMRYLGSMQRADAEQLAEFLVVAAKLLLIKSRLLLPQEPVPGGEPTADVGDELTRQLIEYRQYKRVALAMKELERRGLRGYARIAPRPKIEPKLDLSNVALDDLTALFEAVLAAHQSMPIGDVVAPFVVRVGDKMEELLLRLAQEPRVSFRAWLNAAVNRLEVIVSFLAVLELMKLRKVVAYQRDLFGDFVIEPAPTGDMPSESPPADDEAEPSFIEPE